MIFSTVQAFDHDYTAYNQAINPSVDNGKVDYPKIKKNLHNLVRFLSEASRVSQSEFDGWNQNAQLAYLINYYNAATIKIILDNYPLESIKDIRSPWKKKFIGLFGNKVSLDYIKHEVLRKNYSEPRIHFALVGASNGCPPLRSQAYTAGRLEAILEEQTEFFLRKSPDKNYFTAEKNRLYVSPIFKWYKKDFISHSGSVAEFNRKYMPEISQKPKLKYTKYDWNLNTK